MSEVEKRLSVTTGHKASCFATCPAGKTRIADKEVVLVRRQDQNLLLMAL